MKDSHIVKAPEMIPFATEAGNKAWPNTVKGYERAAKRSGGMTSLILCRVAGEGRTKRVREVLSRVPMFQKDQEEMRIFLRCVGLSNADLSLPTLITPSNIGDYLRLSAFCYSPNWTQTPLSSSA